MLRTIGVGQSDQGYERSKNEDRFFLDDALGLYLVCDGMGGHAMGERAAEVALETTVQQLVIHQEQFESMRRGSGTVEEARKMVGNAVEHANHEVYRQGTQLPSSRRMGTTLTLMLALGGQAVLANVGDSRIYRLRGGQVEQLTHDHTVAQELADQGTISGPEAKKGRFSSVLTRVIGTETSVEVETWLVDLQPGDKYLLCSDGLADYLEDTRQLAKRMSCKLTNIPGDLVNLAKDAGGSDNITALALEVVEAAHAEAGDEAPTVGVEAGHRRD